MDQNLWERLIPELKAAFIEYYKDYPFAGDELKKELENEFYYFRLRYFVLTDLYLLAAKYLRQTDKNFANYFLPK
jgi:hypothetical protein